MTYIVKSALDGWAIDASFPINAALAQKLASTPLPPLPTPGALSRTILGVAQYVSIGTEGAADINAERLQGILDAGLGLWLVQHVHYPSWVASDAVGHAMGAAARQNALDAGYAQKAHLALDLEGCASVGQPVIDFVNAWCEEVSPFFEPLLYVGYCCGLTADQLYAALPLVHAYWSDAGPRKVSTRGFRAKQHMQITHCGIPVDPDELFADALGGRIQWMRAA